MRAPGMGWGRLPLFCWTVLAQSVLIILAMPVIAGAVTLLLTDRHFGTRFYDPTKGGAPCCGSTSSGSSATPRSTS